MSTVSNKRQWTSSDIRTMQEDMNGQEFADSVHARVYDATAHYANMNGYPVSDTVECEVMIAFDVIRLVHCGEFDEMI
jgi:hypothetical protein